MNSDHLKKSLFGMTLPELQDLCSEYAMPSFRAKQIAQWLYSHRVLSIEEMTNLSKADREKLSQDYQIGRREPQIFQESKDGTKKYLYPVGEDKSVEAVYIPDKDRATLCISSQIGCKRACRFCMTGKQGFQGNLSANEILNQIFSLPEFDGLTNIVYMGMGEPLDNLKEVMASLEVLTSSWGLAWSPKRITLSTVGILPQLNHFIEHSQVHLAVSLHHSDSAGRAALMPVEKKHPFREVLAAIRGYDFGRQRRISFEYIMFQGINDSLDCVATLAKELKGMRCRVNLISYHAIPGEELQGSPRESMEAFRDYLSSIGFISTIRASRGQDILAACGMLSTKARKTDSVEESL